MLFLTFLLNVHVQGEPRNEASCTVNMCDPLLPILLCDPLPLILLCIFVLPTVESFNQTMYPPNGVRVYKPLTNKTAPRDGDYDVVFGTAAAYGGRGLLLHTWLLNGRQSGILLEGSVGILTLSGLPNNIDPLIKVEVTLDPSTNQELVTYLHLLGI